MQVVISRCGFRCDLCPAYRENNHTPQDRQKVAEGWWKYYRVEMDPADIFCDGCLAEDAARPKLITPDCAIRPCAIGKGLPNCAHCAEYDSCAKLAGFIEWVPQVKATLDEIRAALPE